MQKVISTNIQIPETLWKAVKVKAAKEGKSMKTLIVEGLDFVLKKGSKTQPTESLNHSLLKFSAKISISETQGSENHDDIIYG